MQVVAEALTSMNELVHSVLPPGPALCLGDKPSGEEVARWPHHTGNTDVHSLVLVPISAIPLEIAEVFFL